jgi:hypothetical protein
MSFILEPSFQIPYSLLRYLEALFERLDFYSNFVANFCNISERSSS